MLTDPSKYHRTEVVTVATAHRISVCLVNTGQGTPFISGLDMRPIKSSLYSTLNALGTLVLLTRHNLGGNDVRFPADPYDRYWLDDSEDIPSFEQMNTKSSILYLADDQFQVPSPVMQSAIYNSSRLEIILKPVDFGDLNKYFAVMHFCEVQSLPQDASRQFFVFLNDALLNEAKSFTPEFLYSQSVYNKDPIAGFSDRYINISLVQTSNSTLPPILNAIEVFSAMKNTNKATDIRDVDAMMGIKEFYLMKKNWNGDPCTPKIYMWDGLNCSSNASGTPRITTLNLSNSGLAGEISTFFANISAIQYLDLSHNNLTGPIPAALGSIASLKLLDLRNNQLNGSVPPALLERSQNGLLTLRMRSYKSTFFSHPLPTLELILLHFSVAAFLVREQSITQSLGFVFIDCGIPANSTYADPNSGITYISDEQFTDTGINYNVLYGYVNNLARRYSTFDLYLNVNLWRTINVTDPSKYHLTEVVTVATAHRISVCLVNTGQGTPFISGLDLRPINSSLYSSVNALGTDLVLLTRHNLGGNDIRFPVDPYDRYWLEDGEDIPSLKKMNTNSSIQYLADDLFQVPSPVMQSAIYNSSRLEIIMKHVDFGDLNEYFAVMHFCELQSLPQDASRQLFVFLNDALLNEAKSFTPEFLYSQSVYNKDPIAGFSVRYINISLVQSFDAMMGIKEFYQVKKIGTAILVLQKLEKITKNFEKIIGRGGFGPVYHGYLENETQVAIKVLSETSSQGTKEFLVEVQFLTRIHHKNLFALVGYCKDKKFHALVYEYMSQGSVHDHLIGKPGTTLLSWHNRLRIALEVAKGLEYMHYGCRPTLIHRDIKSKNILLNDKFEAKISDLGISELYKVTCKLMLLQGWYHGRCQLTKKSDVYSFGVVLLELKTGQRPILQSPERYHIVEWVKTRLSQGNIDQVLDGQLQGVYDANSAWKCIDIAIKCTAQASAERPTIANVVVELTEILQLEMAENQNQNVEVNHMNENNSFEAGQNSNTWAMSDPSAR
ncbi:Receptor-like protein kinase [Canna indica]|uniref:non-specific serine/threonine protein kinase n=1 Tax=Canna indica TaxID=4628 RepID=A0AAQ3KNX4_9LILI|nr:Receptor-like protein kinase [Canna indica]